MVSVSSLGLHLQQLEENVAEIDALADRLGGRVGLEPLLDDLDRRARRTLAPGLKVHRAWTWDRVDRRDERWWPQGISTSADAARIGGGQGELGDRGELPGRSLVAVAWYAKKLPGDDIGQGSRISFLDLDTRRYRHVLLVVPRIRDGVLDLAPLRVHAGGIVWVGEHLHVAATAKGLMTCRLDDLLRVPDALVDPQPGRHGLRLSDTSVSTYGYRYVLPVRFAYRAETDDGVERLRYSFASLDRAADPPAVVVGEYGRGSQTTRIARFPLDRETGLLETDTDGRVTPLHLDDHGVRGAQGVAVVGDTVYVTVSRGPRLPGSIFVGRPGAFREHRYAVPMGVEDVGWWPSRNELWTATEHPRRRWVISVKRSRLAP